MMDRQVTEFELRKVRNAFNSALTKGQLKLALVVIFCVALTLRLAFGVFWVSQLSIPPQQDAEQNDILAQNLLAGRGLSYSPPVASPPLPATNRVPLYPIFLATIYAVFGVNYSAVQVVQAFMGALLCLIIFSLAASIFNHVIGLGAAAFAAIYQPFIQYYFYGGPAFLISENLSLFLLALMGLVLFRAVREGSISSLILSGILLGLAALTRSEIALFPVVLFFIFLYKESGSLKSSFRQIGYIFIAFLLVLTPWIIRNYRVHYRFVPFSTDGGNVFIIGNNMLAKGSAVPVEAFLGEKDLKELSELSVVDRDRLLFAKGVEFWKQYPSRLPKLFLKKILVFWSVYNEGGPYNISYGLMLPFVFIGIVLVLRTGWAKPERFILLAFVVNSLLIAVIFFGYPRYRLPIEPYLIILAAYGVSPLFKNSSALFSTAILSCWLGLNIVVYLYWSTFYTVLRSFASWVRLSGV